jgi:hypothetical protein
LYKVRAATPAHALIVTVSGCPKRLISIGSGRQPAAPPLHDLAGWHDFVEVVFSR